MKSFSIWLESSDDEDMQSIWYHPNKKISYHKIGLNHDRWIELHPEKFGLTTADIPPLPQQVLGRRPPTLPDLRPLAFSKGWVRAGLGIYNSFVQGGDPQDIWKTANWMSKKAHFKEPLDWASNIGYGTLNGDDLKRYLNSNILPNKARIGPENRSFNKILKDTGENNLIPKSSELPIKSTWATEAKRKGLWHDPRKWTSESFKI